MHYALYNATVSLQHHCTFSFHFTAAAYGKLSHQTFGERRSKERRSERRSLNRERNVNGRSVFRWGTGTRTERTSFWKGMQTEREQITSAFLSVCYKNSIKNSKVLTLYKVSLHNYMKSNLHVLVRRQFFEKRTEKERKE